MTFHNYESLVDNWVNWGRIECTPQTHCFFVNRHQEENCPALVLVGHNFQIPAGATLICSNNYMQVQTPQECPVTIPLEEETHSVCPRGFRVKSALQRQNKSKISCEDTDAGKRTLSTMWHILLTGAKRLVSKEDFIPKELQKKFVKAHRDKDLNFWRHVLWSDVNWTFFLIMIWMKKWGSLQAKEHHLNGEVWGWQHVVRVFCCSRVWCTSQIKWHHKERTLLYVISYKAA